MSISSIASNSAMSTSAVRPQAIEAQVARRDARNDGDSDDGSLVAKAPAPTVNLSGQTIGKLVSVSA